MPPKTREPSSQPIIRINEVDTIEAVTDYSYAMDHAITVKKWAEMDIPIVMPFSSNSTGDIQYKTVFDEKHDITAISRRGRNLSRANRSDLRWRFKGPYLIGMGEAEFETYVKRHVRPKRPAFREFVRDIMWRKREEERKSRITNRLLPRSTSSIKRESVTDEQVEERLKRLRENKPELFRYVRAFLDLPPLHFARPMNDESYLKGISASGPQVVSPPSPYAITGPPLTHPSAGMFYSLSNNYLENHPVYGPQKQHIPFRSQIINVKHPFGNTATVGVGGIAHEVYMDFIVKSGPSQGIDRTRAFTQLNTAVPELSKIWVTVSGAHITSDGGFKLELKQASDASQLVAKELMGEVRPIDKYNPATRAREVPPSQRYMPKSYPTVLGGAKSYGLGSKLGM